MSVSTPISHPDEGDFEQSMETLQAETLLPKDEIHPESEWESHDAPRLYCLMGEVTTGHGSPLTLSAT
jgi:hypothetical protein